jgi:hypothetical protein
MQNQHPSRTPTLSNTTCAPVHKVTPATTAIKDHLALVYKFSHGTGLIVYINGELVSAARVALQVNIATLKYIKKLSSYELDAVGQALAVAFAHSLQTVRIAYAEMSCAEEQAWRDAEREWETFSGGPYEYPQSSFPTRSLRRVKRSWFGNPTEVTERRTHRCESLRDTMAKSLQTSSADSSFNEYGSVQIQDRHIMTDAEFDALPNYDDTSSYLSSWLDETIELCVLKRPMTLRESFSDLYSNKDKISISTLESV